MSLVNTRIQNIRTPSNMDKYEYRGSRYGALDFFIQETNKPNGILTPDIKAKARESIGNRFQTMVMDYVKSKDIVMGWDGRTLTIEDDENQSQMLDLDFTTYSWGFTIIPAMYMNNEFDIQRDFETKFERYMLQLAKKLDEACLAKLADLKTPIYNEKLLYTVNGDQLLCNFTDRENILGDIDPMMSANDYYGDLHLIGGPPLEAMLRKLMQHGVYNDVNKTLEYQNLTCHITNYIQKPGGVYSKFWAVNGGSFGLLWRFERECLMNRTMPDGTEWGISSLPLFDIPVGTYFYVDKGDYRNSTLNPDGLNPRPQMYEDMTRTYKEHYGFSIEVAIVGPYMSKPNEMASPVMQVCIGNPSTSEVRLEA